MPLVAFLVCKFAETSFCNKLCSLAFTEVHLVPSVSRRCGLKVDSRFFVVRIKKVFSFIIYMLQK